MKNLRFLAAVLMTLCLVQGVWAIAPGGALGGGGKAAQAHPAHEGKVVAEPVQTLGPVVDESMVSTSAEAPIVSKPTKQQDVTIGKTAAEGQSNQEVGDEAYAKAVQAHNSKKEMRRQLKDAIHKYHAQKRDSSPESPADDSMILYIILAILIPPLAVALYLQGVPWEFWVCLLLTLLFFLPGIIFALWVILAE